MTATRFAASMLCLAAGTAFAYTDYPLYVVNVADNGLTNMLDSATVQVYDTAESTPVDTAFSSLSLTTGTFVKRGDGWLRSSPAMTNFTGTIYIEEGVVEATGPGQFGPATKSAGELWILDGATLIVNPIYGVCGNYGMNIWNKVHVAGSGFDGKGAIRRILTYYNGNNAVNGGETFKGSMTFEGDTIIDCGNYSAGLGEYIWLAASGNYQMKGHSLTIPTGVYKINSARIYAGDEPAAIVYGDGTHDGRFQIQSGFYLYGDSRSSLTVKSKSLLHGYNAGNMSTPWTLNLEGNSSIKLGGSDTANFWKTSAKTAHQWKGPINVGGKVTVDCNTTFGNMHFSAIGPLHGAGDMFVTRGYLHLFNPSNDFTGSVYLNPATKTCLCGLGFWEPEAWPSNNTHAVAVTNAAVYLDNNSVAYRLPALNFHVADASYTNAHFSGVGMGCMPSFSKTGNGDLDIEVPLVVTGRTELAGGRLLINSPAVYSYAPGLYESKHRTDMPSIPADVLKAYYTDGTIAETNGVTYYPKMAEHYNSIKGNPVYVEGNWSSNMIARYEGYLWNRNPTPTRYGFALAFCAKAKLLIDDQLVFEGQGNWYYLRTNTVELTTGHHKFDLRLYTTQYTDPGARYQTSIPPADFRFEGEPKGQTDVVWNQPNKGFVWRVGEATPHCSDYEVPSNRQIAGVDGGDGFVFTRDTNEFATVRSSAVFSNFVCTAGTELALEHSTQELFVPKFVGVTCVTNGNLGVGESWTLRTADVAANGVLEVAGSLTFYDGAKLLLDQEDAHLRYGEYIIAAADSIVGMPQYVPANTSARGWRLSSGTDIQGRQTLMLTWISGTILSIR